MTTTLPAERQKAFDDFYTGATIHDVQQMRAALTDDFTFRGPMMAFDNPDAFVESLLGVDGKVTNSRLIIDGEHVAHLYVLDIGRKIPMCDVLEFRENHICSMELYTDSKLFDPENAH